MAKQSSRFDAYGDKGEIPDASWTARWMRWNHSQQDEYMAAMAQAPLLGARQMGEIIQGLLPTPSTWITPMTRLSGDAPVLDRLSQDIARGAFPKAATPDEFAAWCDQYGVQLPVAFVRGLADAAAAGSTPTVCPQSPITIAPPKWLPLPIQGQKAAAVKPAKGRPRSAAHNYERVIVAGGTILMGAARAGRNLTIEAVATSIAGTPDGCGMTEKNILRRLKGKLPVDQARATADRRRKPSP
jgi:hypothetical protein